MQILSDVSNGIALADGIAVVSFLKFPTNHREAFHNVVLAPGFVRRQVVWPQGPAAGEAYSVLDGLAGFHYQLAMSKAVKLSEAGKADNVPFEEALKRLETIVETMESEDLPLETLLARFEEGTRLVKVCQAKLTEAEIKIQKLEKNSAGEAVLKPLPSDLAEEN
jgi:exodeoxyribonuclease VII small subunit